QYKYVTRGICDPSLSRYSGLLTFTARTARQRGGGAAAMADLFLMKRLEALDKEVMDIKTELKTTLEELRKNPRDTILHAERNRLVEALADLNAHRKNLKDKLSAEAISLGMVSTSEAGGTQPSTDDTGPAGASASCPVVSISGIDWLTWQGIGEALGLTIVPVSKAPLTALQVHETEPFSWQPQTEADPINCKAAVQYLNRMVPPPANQEWYDSSTKHDMLSRNLSMIELNGTSDVALCTSAAVRGNMPEYGLRIVVQLKKDKAELNPIELATELLTANLWSPSFKPIAVMTDLMDTWCMMWAAKERIKMYPCEGRAEAVGILRAFLEQERLKPDSGGIMPQQDNRGAEAEVGGLLDRPRLLSACGAREDVANLDDLLDFGDGLGLSDTDLHELRCYKQLRALQQLALQKQWRR
ncbi:hypothetical protein Vretimale_12211, partial [Volvox reticuliferus]